MDVIYHADPREKDWTKISQPFIERLEKTESTLLETSNIIQFTIDFMQYWKDEFNDYGRILREEIGALQYRWGNLVSVMDPRRPDYHCVTEMLSIVKEWGDKIEESISKELFVEEAKKAMDEAAQGDAYEDWNDLTKCLYDTTIGHPGMYTLDDVVIKAIEIFSQSKK